MSDESPQIIEVLMHDVIRPDFERWLASRGLELQRTPFLDESPDLPVYNVAPTEALMRLISNRKDRA